MPGKVNLRYTMRSAAIVVALGATASASRILRHKDVVVDVDS